MSVQTQNYCDRANTSQQTIQTILMQFYSQIHLCEPINEWCELVHFAISPCVYVYRVRQKAFDSLKESNLIYGLCIC